VLTAHPVIAPTRPVAKIPTATVRSTRFQRLFTIHAPFLIIGLGSKQPTMTVSNQTCLQKTLNKNSQAKNRKTTNKPKMANSRQEQAKDKRRSPWP
jgi:hypothetical protein